MFKQIELKIGEEREVDLGMEGGVGVSFRIIANCRGE